jgi:hypothetical protein
MNMQNLQENEYSQYFEQIAQMEIKLAQLLDHLVESIENSDTLENVEQQSHALAIQASNLAKHIRKANYLDIQEYMQELSGIEKKSQQLMECIPNSLMHAQQKKWAQKLEEITSSLHRLREAHSFLSSSVLQSRQKREAHATFLRLLNSTKTKIDIATDGIIHKKHAMSNQTYLKLSRIKEAVVGVKAHIRAESAKKSKDLLAPHSKLAKDKMRSFLSNELEGKVHIDFDVIKLTSKLSEKEEQWAHNEVNGHAIEMLFEGTEMTKIIANARKRNSTIIASFVCKPDQNGILAEFDAHERIITEDGVIAKPYQTRILI